MDLVLKLSKKVEGLETELKNIKQIYEKSKYTRRKFQIIISEDEADLPAEDSSKQGMMIEDIDLDVDTSLVQPHAVEDFHFVTPTKISALGEAYSLDISLKDQLRVLSAAKIIADAGKNDIVPKTVSKVQTYTRRRRDVNTGSEAVNTASDFFSVAKASVNNAGDSIPVKDKDPSQREGKAVMELDERVEVIAKVNQAHDIDWSDPAVLRYHALQNRSFSVAEVRKNMCTYLKNQGGYKQNHFKRMSYEDIRPIFESVWDQNHAFVPKDSEIEKEQLAGEEKEKKKDAESSKQVEEEIVQQEDVVAEQVVKESSKKAGGRLKRKVAKGR
ncbi:hypothetical protein Tco_1482024, partial [Tanacetum coccineum]